MSVLEVLSAGPGVTVQDAGRPGYLAQGLSRGGAADRLALAEGAALLRQEAAAALEMAGMGGRFKSDAPLRFALTGAPMRAQLDGTPLAWNASHHLPAGAVLQIDGARGGVYGYLSVGGGFSGARILGAQSAHLAAGIGRALQAGDRLKLGEDKGGPVGLCLQPMPREADVLRLVPSLQTGLFPAELRDRFEAETFSRDARGNRMGVRMMPSGEGFGLETGQTILSEVIAPGDIQIPGDGVPYVLLAECQTTGGYPRIGTVIPADLPPVAQAPPGAKLRFRFVTRDEALAAEREFRNHVKGLRDKVQPLVRDPADVPDLLSLNLVSGVIDAREGP